MASLLDYIGLGATAAARQGTARMEGEGIAKAAAERDLLARLQQQRQAQMDARQAQMDDLNRRNIESQMTDRDADNARALAASQMPTAPVRGTPQYIQMLQDEERAKLAVQPPKPLTPQTPVRGTPEYNAMLEAEARARATGGGGERGAQLPAAAIEKMIDLDDIIGMTKRARTSLAGAVRDGRDVTGRMGGVVPVAGWLRNTFRQGGEEGIGVRSELANVSSSIMKLRSGAAVSDQEFARLEPFLASDDDDESVAMVKLRKLAQALEEMKRIRLENYQRYGKRGMEQTRGVDPETGVDMDDAIDAVLGRQP